MTKRKAPKKARKNKTTKGKVRSAKASTRPSAPVVDPHGWRSVTRQQLGMLLGVHPDTVTDYVRGGMPVVTRGGHGRESEYDAVECLAWWRKGQGKNAKEEAQARAYGVSADLNELKLAQQRGELWPREQIVLAGQNTIKGWSAAITALPHRMTHAGLITRDQEPGVATLLTELLREIAAWKPLPTDAQVA